MKIYLLTWLFAMLMIVTGTGLSHAATPGNVHFYTFYNYGSKLGPEIPVENTNFTMLPGYLVSAKCEGATQIYYEREILNEDGSIKSSSSSTQVIGSDSRFQSNSVVTNPGGQGDYYYKVTAYGIGANGEKGPKRTIILTRVAPTVTFSPEPGTYPKGTKITITANYNLNMQWIVDANGNRVSSTDYEISNTYTHILKEDTKFESTVKTYHATILSDVYVGQYYISKDVEIKAYVDGEEVKTTDELPEGTEVTFKAEGAGAIAYAPYSVTGSRHPNLTRVDGESVTVTIDKMHRRFYVDALSGDDEHVAGKDFFFNVKNASYDLALHYTTYNVRDYYGAEDFSTIYKPMDEHNLMDRFVEVSKNKHQLKNNDDLCGQFAISINGQEIGGDVSFKNDTFHSHLSTYSTGNTSCSKNHEGYVPVSDGYTIPLHNMTFDDGVENTKAVAMSTNPNHYHWELTLYNADKSTITVNLNPFYSANFTMDVQEGGTTGVDDIAVEEVDENAPAVYYDLNGRRVAGTPTSGLYIEVRGKKAQKVLIH